MLELQKQDVPSKSFTGTLIVYDKEGKPAGKKLYQKGELIAEAPSNWDYLTRESLYQSSKQEKLLLHYERILDITNKSIVFQHGTLYCEMKASEKEPTYPKGKEIIPTYTYTHPRSGVTEVRPYTDELRERARKMEGRGLYQFGTEASFCVCTTAKFYKRPGIMHYIDKAYTK